MTKQMQKITVEDEKRRGDVGYIQSYAESDTEDGGQGHDDDSSFELDQDDDEVRFRG
jgi:hypothetical protein